MKLKWRHPTFTKEKMYCKVCYDSGKPEEVFMSHDVKNEFGMVTCVTLLSHHCETCGCIGHTPKYCPTQSTKFCPFCKKNGKEFTSHNMWEDGLMVCLELQAQQCTNCGNMGHTPKYCTAYTKFCPVCRDAGRDHDHDLMENDVVVCEYLLSLKCGNCGEMGHTPKYCTVPRKFCPVCRDAGREYNHHLMENGVVVCEYLLGLECPNCGEMGHTRKYCSAPRRKTAMQRLQEGLNLDEMITQAIVSASVPQSRNKGKKKFVRIM